MKLNGKQLRDNTITQDKIGITTESVINNNDATTKEWVETHVDDEIEKITYSTSNLNMAGLTTISNNGPMLACDSAISSQPISSVRITINGMEINVGSNIEPFEGFFSPDGIIIRNSGDETIGDKFYWNTYDYTYQLDSNDVIDFIYLIKE